MHTFIYNGYQTPYNHSILTKKFRVESKIRSIT
jgi:hypothetical protein